MISKNRVLRKKLSIIIFIYLVLSCFLFVHYKYFFDSPDALQYIIISQKYIDGNFTGAINSFWSPLLSWMLSIILIFGIEPFTAAKILQIVIGVFALIGIDLLFSDRSNKIVYFVLMFSLAVFILYCALLVFTPDLLFLTLSIWYAVLLHKKTYYFNEKFSPVTIGMLGALLYFSKSIGFVFFLLSFSIFNIIVYIEKRSLIKTLLWKYLFTALIFLGISSFWIFCISKKEKHFVISSAANYNMTIISPAVNPDVFAELKHPNLQYGLLSPPNKSSLSAWEEPHKQLHKIWSPFSSKKNLKHYMHVIGRNLLSIQSFFFGLDAGTVLIFLLLFLWFCKKEEVKLIFKNNCTLLVLSFCCTLPYIFLLVMQRYLWLNNVVIVILAYFAFNKLIANNRIFVLFFLFVFVALVIRSPLVEFVKYCDEHKNIFVEQQKISDYVNSGNTASIVSPSEVHSEHYAKSSLVSFFSHSQYYGMISVYRQSEKMSEELKNHHIQYLLSWNDSYKISDFLYSKNKNFPNIGLKIYKLK